MPDENARPPAAGQLAGEPDGFDRLWTPHRMDYIDGPARPVAGAGDTKDCPFCAVPALGDDAGLVVARGALAYVVLNKYPYNTGHVLVCPYRHVGDYADLERGELVEMAELTQTAVRVLRESYGADGVNLGMNLGYERSLGWADFKANLSVYNLLNRQEPVWVYQELEPGVGDRNDLFGEERFLQSPRYGQLTLSLEF